jgi:hypothetical protein
MYEDEELMAEVEAEDFYEGDDDFALMEDF